MDDRPVRGLKNGYASDARPIPGLGSILGAPPFAERTRLSGAEWINPSHPAYTVAVPVRDEIELLPRALAALRVAMDSHVDAGTLVFAVNNTTDGSATLLRAWARETGCSCVVLNVTFARLIRNAPHSRRIAMDVGAAIAPDGDLLTTDADSYVGANWIGQARALLANGFDMICEDVRLDEGELALLPRQVRHTGEVERAYFAALSQLWERWTSGGAGAFAFRASGASIAIRSRAYTDVGRLPLPAHGEDSALCARMVERGYAVAQANDLGTRTSARLQGRASGGCGEALTTRSIAADPDCDAALLPIAALRQCAADGSLASLDASPPMRLSEVERELALALRILAHGDRAVA
ncbi:hypothetical protein TMRO357_01426 [Alteriqipengyuania sp. 357]